MTWNESAHTFALGKRIVVLEIVLSVISIFGTILTIIFAYIAFRRNEKYDVKNNAKSEGALLSDIGYIKSSIDRMEEKLDKQENNYQMLLTRVIKVEEAYNILNEKIEIYISEANGK